VLTAELFFYLALVFLGCMFSIVKFSSFFYYFFSMIAFASFSIVVRRAGFDADIGNYKEYLEINSFSIYYLKEPFYWLGSRFIYEVTNSPFAVFVFYDLIFFSLILYVTYKAKLPRYFPYATLLFFPSVLGMQNVFRQFIASGFLLLFFCYVITGASFMKKFFAIIFAIATHNVSALFFPFIFIRKDSRKVPILFFLSASAILFLLPLAAGTKSNSITGELPPYLYLIMLSALVILYLIVLSLRFKPFPPEFFIYFLIMIYMMTLVFTAMFVTGEAQTKRLGMLSMLLMLIPLVKVIDYRFKQKLLVRVLFLVILAMPTLVFNNARSLLFTNEESLAVEAAARSRHGEH
jgi:hypothetical protein